MKTRSNKKLCISHKTKNGTISITQIQFSEEKKRTAHRRCSP